MLQLCVFGRYVAETLRPVVITGENGVGKRRFSRWVHSASGLNGKFISVDCGAGDSEQTISRITGAFAHHATQGAGTLAIRHISQLCREGQEILLAAINGPKPNTTRVVASTTKPLAPQVARNLFDRDLFFLLGVLRIDLPPLRDRPNDIVLLAGDAASFAASRDGRPAPRIDLDAVNLLLQYSWPGNLAELNEVVGAAVRASTSSTLAVGAFSHLKKRLVASHARPPDSPSEEPFFDALVRFEKRYMRDLLLRTTGNISQAARVAGLSRAAVRNKARTHGLTDATDGRSPPTPIRSRVRRT